MLTGPMSLLEVQLQWPPPFLGVVSGMGTTLEDIVGLVGHVRGIARQVPSFRI